MQSYRLPTLTACSFIWVLFISNTKGNSVSKPMEHQEKEAREDVGFDYDYAPFYRFAGKRSDGGDQDMGADPCALHRYTLLELHDMVKEEVADFETCLAKQPQY
eukprot:TRINITY_DN13377_c0_g1_i2.p1 TRINITY_DN13377_c0_g1~~TRINITY_DN13377_c0_g1_i2.p1  ORF type:complete len:104 (+),score=29.40 TRINITY_DN13377_c0_g1_i2:25-336(+)